ncbi:MAG TPA: hypothetical protein VF530_17705, partial [Planctomycetota bacterium]
LTGTLEYEGELPETTTVMLMPRPVPRPDGTYSHWAESGRAVFAVDGRFEAQFLERGSYRVIAHVSLGAMGLAMGSVEVEVPEEGTLDVRIRLERRR